MKQGMEINLRGVVEEDLPNVTAMNQRLVEDEGSRNPFSEAQYRQRLRSWLQSAEWEVVLFTDSVGNSLGYAAYRLKADAYWMEKKVIEIRQFFIDRPFRGLGLGSAAYKVLAEERFEGWEVFLDVLATNPRGRRFWERMGFSEYCVSMRKIRRTQ